MSSVQIVKYYGTHILLDIYLGGKMDVKFQSETMSRNREYASRIGVKTGIKKVFDIDISNDIDIKEANKNFNEKLSYRTRGGNPAKGLFGEINLEQSISKLDVSNWQNSLSVDNMVLVDFGKNGLIPIYEIIEDENKKRELKKYVDEYLSENSLRLKYNNPLSLKDGDFVRNRYTGEVFFIFENRLRYIQSPMTLFGLFIIKNTNIRDVNPSEISGMLLGSDLTPDNDLRQDVRTNKIYLREGNILRYIPNRYIYDKYKFNDNAVRRIRGIGEYVIKEDIQ